MNNIEDLGEAVVALAKAVNLVSDELEYVKEDTKSWEALGETFGELGLILRHMREGLSTREEALEELGKVIEEGWIK